MEDVESAEAVPATMLTYNPDNMILDNVESAEAVPIENEINNEILKAFAPMEVDYVINPAQASTEIEKWDPYFNVERFSSLNNPHGWYNLDKVRVIYVWMDENNKKLYIIFLDKYGEKQGAEVPEDLVELYNNRDLGGNVFSLNHFQISYTDPTQYPRYQNYSLLRCDWEIMVNSKTVLTELNPFTDHSDIPTHPWLPSIRALLGDKSIKKMFIDTIGRVTKGGLIQHRIPTTCELFLRDVTGAEIRFITYHTLREEPVKLARVILDKGVICIYRAKLIHTETMNLLVDTELTKIEYNPTIKQAGPLKAMKL